MSGNLKAVYQEEWYNTTSIPCAWATLQELATELENGWVVFWQHHQIALGKIENTQIEWLTEAPIEGEDHLMRVRAFNEAVEYHFWRSGKQIKGRKRVDSLTEPKDTSCVDTKMMLRSELAKPLKSILGEKPNLAVLTRNYIGYENPEVPQAGYVDSRFVEFLIF